MNNNKQKYQKSLKNGNTHTTLQTFTLV